MKKNRGVWSFILTMAVLTAELQSLTAPLCVFAKEPAQVVYAEDKEDVSIEEDEDALNGRENDPDDPEVSEDEDTGESEDISEETDEEDRDGVSDDSASDDSASKNSASENSTSEDSASEDSASKNSASEDSTSEDSASKNSASEDSTSDDSASKNSASDDSASKDSASEDSASGNSASENSTSENSASENSTSENSASGTSASENSTSENSTSDNTVSGNIKVGPGGTYATLKDAFSAISKKPGEYTFDIGKELTELKALKLPKGNFSITITGGNLVLKSTSIAVNCDTVFDCNVEPLKANKKLKVKVAADKSVTFNKTPGTISTISGKKDSSSFTAKTAVTADNVKNFKNVTARSSSTNMLTVNKVMSGIGELNGYVIVGTKATLGNIGNARLYLTEKSAKKTSITGVSTKLGIGYADGKAVASGTPLISYKGPSSVSVGEIVILKNENGKVFNGYVYGKTIKAEHPKAVEVSFMRRGEPEEHEKEDAKKYYWQSIGYYHSIEEAFKAIDELSDKRNTRRSFRVELAYDILAENVKMPEKTKYLYLYGAEGGSVLDMGKTKDLAADTKLTVRDLHLQAKGKDAGISASDNTLTLEDVTAGRITTVSDLSISGTVNVTGNVNAGQLSSKSDSSTLSFVKLSVTGGGVTEDSSRLTLRVVNKKGVAVKYKEGAKIKAVTKFVQAESKKDVSGNSASENAGGTGDPLSLLSLSPENCPPDASKVQYKLELRSGKLYLVRSAN